MCNSRTPAEEPSSDVQTFESVPEFLEAVEPGMDLCTSDFTGWATVECVDQTGAHVVGRVHDSGQVVRVPANVLLEIRGGHCVRLDRVRATVNRQGWEVAETASVAETRTTA